MSSLTQFERTLITATQSGLPLVAEPYAEIARMIGTSEAQVLEGLRGFVRRGLIRRIGAAPNHYALGLTANGMTVWDVDDPLAKEIGARVGALEFVTHCYLRPRALPLWPYNLFAMVHGTTRCEVEKKRAKIARLLGDACRASDVLYSRRILKKSGLRLSQQGG